MDMDEQINMTQTLIINEMIEFMVPIAYIISFLTAFYGPNADIIGNISNDYWQYSEVEDVGSAIRDIWIFFFFEFCCRVLSAIVLWKLCRINMYNAYIEIQKEFGLAFSVQMALGLNAVS